MRTVTIIIPTIGKARTRKITAPTTGEMNWVTQIRSVIKRSAESARSAGYEPHILLVDESKDKIPARSLEVAAKGINAKVETIRREDTGLMGGFLDGARYAISAHKPTVIAMGIDDYVTESKSLANLLAALSRKKDPADFVTGKWKPKSGPTFPKAQAHNEIMTSGLVTFCRPDVAVKDHSFESTVQQAEHDGKFIQTYTTFTAMTPRAFQILDHYMAQQYHELLPQIRLTGIEPLMLASAYANGLKVENAVIARRFEHAYPKNRAQQAAFINSRGRQFADGARALRRFLEVTGQTQKIAIFDQMVRQTIEQLTPKTGPQSRENKMWVRKPDKSEKFPGIKPMKRKIQKIRR